MPFFDKKSVFYARHNTLTIDKIYRILYNIGDLYGGNVMTEEYPLPDNETNDEKREEKQEEKSISADLIRGHINTIILRALYDGDKYGYEIIAEIENKSHGQYSLKQPSLYSALKRLEAQNYVTSYWGGSVGGGRRKYFSLTDEGKKISEQNQAEWEYSRTVIDSLISDKDFDFNNPAPTVVNMRVLKSSTSRVPNRSENGEDSFGYSPSFGDGAEQEAELTEKRLALELERARAEEEFAERKTAWEEERARTEAELIQRREALHAEREDLEAQKAELSARSEAASEQENYGEQLKERELELQQERALRAEEILKREQEISEERERYQSLLKEREEQLALERETHARQLEEQEARIREEQDELFRRRERQLIHENYIKLVNAPPETQEDTKGDYSYYTRPVAEEVMRETEELSSVNQLTESGQEYRTVINKLYHSAIKTDGLETNPSRPERAHALGGIDFYDLEARAAQDGIKISTAGGTYSAESAEISGSIVNKGKALFLSAIVLFFICLAEGSIVLALQSKFSIPLFLPFFIWGIGLALLLVTGVAFANRFAERALRRSSPVIINAIVIYALLVIFTLIVALGVNIDFTSASALATYVVIPIIFFFGVVIFGLLYYIQIKPKKE